MRLHTSEWTKSSRFHSLDALMIRKREFGYVSSFGYRCVMPNLLRWPSLLCHKDDTGISTMNKSPSLSVTYNGYIDCTFGPRLSRRFPLCSVHPLDEKTAWIPTSSSYPIEISDHVSFGTYQTSWRTMLKPPKRFCSVVPMLIITKCWELSTRIKSKFQAVFYRTCDRYGVTW